jgi:hypothetical protein
LAKLKHSKAGRPFSIRFSSELEDTIFNIISIHNIQNPKKKVGIDVARKVVDRGISACMGNNNLNQDRSAFGLARLRMFLLRKLGVKSRYSADNDLLNK